MVLGVTNRLLVHQWLCWNLIEPTACPRTARTRGLCLPRLRRRHESRGGDATARGPGRQTSDPRKRCSPLPTFYDDYQPRQPSTV